MLPVLQLPVTKFSRVKGDTEIPLNTWVHVAGVYDGQNVKLFVNGIEQQQVKQVTGNIFINPTRKTRLGNKNFFGRLEETRISNVSRVGCDPGEIVTTDVRRKFFYSGWRVIEEREQTAAEGQTLGQELPCHEVENLLIDPNTISKVLKSKYYNKYVSKNPQEIKKDLEDIAKKMTADVIREMVAFRMNALLMPQDYSMVSICKGVDVLEDCDSMAILKKKFLETANSRFLEVQKFMAEESSSQIFEEVAKEVKEWLSSEFWVDFFPGKELLDALLKKYGIDKKAMSTFKVHLVQECVKTPKNTLQQTLSWLKKSSELE
ncbi:LamG domain-containing protein [Candidatus Uabimicrobium sp. HlEnr_7]|uniref:LamG domain-containing protein n=1 Tax=Candidatus Uabimicrobium helgolandensis TaxID=3095367 RepID=UPI00355806C7